VHPLYVLQSRGFAISFMQTAPKRAEAQPPRSIWLLPLIQVLLVLLPAPLLVWAAGPAQALGLLAGGAAVALGQVLYLWRTERGGKVLEAGKGLARLITGMLLKWLAIAAALVWALRSDHFEPAYVLAGAVLATLVHPFCLSWLRR